MFIPFDKLIITLLGLALIGFIYWFFLSKKDKGEDHIHG